MFCKYCGTEISDDSIFCSKCGKNVSTKNNIAITKSNQDTITKNSTPRMFDHLKNIPIKSLLHSVLSFFAMIKTFVLSHVRLFVICAGIVAFVPLAVFLVSKITSYEPRQSYRDFVLDACASFENKNMNVFYQNGTSPDSTNMAYLGFDTSELYVQNSESSTLIARNVSIFAISSDSNSIAYIEKGNTVINEYGKYVSPDNGTLYLYSSEHDKQLIDTNVIYGNVCISNDGKTIGYTKRIDNNTLYGYVYNDGNIIEIGLMNRPIAVGDELVCYLNIDTDYFGNSYNNLFIANYISSQPSDVFITDDPTYIYSNNDFSEFIVIDDHQTIYSITRDSLSVIGTFDNEYELYSLYDYIYPLVSYECFSFVYDLYPDIKIFKYGTKTFSDTIFIGTNDEFDSLYQSCASDHTSDFEIYYMNDGVLSQKYSHDDCCFKFSSIDNKLHVFDRFKLYSYECNDGSVSTFMTPFNKHDILKYVMTGDGIYCLDYDDNFFFVNYNNKRTNIANMQDAGYFVKKYGKKYFENYNKDTCSVNFSHSSDPFSYLTNGFNHDITNNAFYIKIIFEETFENSQGDFSTNSNCVLFAFIEGKAHDLGNYEFIVTLPNSINNFFPERAYAYDAFWENTYLIKNGIEIVDN